MFLPVTVVAQLVRGVHYGSGRLVSSSFVRLPNQTRVSSDRVRSVCTTGCLRHGEYEWRDPKNEDEIVNVAFVDKDGKRTSVKGKIGDNVLYLAHR